ncbi:hypothetical protein [Microbulbifer spongiae]|uniref:Uncharacterized protein n=1 Tax=Microbulbifer spongiae TaxID=2944933 RepID=A0ABY9EBM9_9GAMM|nr:hypothetical protein [Microbulbifer sp. MI-G]WKD49697.1 hypothetical protein M8T91_17680 [Microbulbifer sp. MI-G]
MTGKKLSEKELDKLEKIIKKTMPKELRTWLVNQTQKSVILTCTHHNRTYKIVSGYKTIYNRYKRLLNNRRKKLHYSAVEHMIFLGHQPQAQDLGYFYLDPIRMEVIEFSDYCEKIGSIGYFTDIFHP